MSFMFSPYPYDDPTPVNRPAVSKAAAGGIVSGTHAVALLLAKAIRGLRGRAVVVAMDGYPTACWERLVNLVAQDLARDSIALATYDIADRYRSAGSLEKELAPLLPTDRAKDPVLLFGTLLRGGYERILDPGRLADLRRELEELKQSGREQVALVYGCGSATRDIRGLCDIVVYLDVTPKQAMLRARGGRYANLGDRRPRPARELLRRCYYVDFEAAGGLRRELLQERAIDYYISSDDQAHLKLLPRETLDEVLSALAKMPFRCKPVYLEGIWGGTYVKRLRKLPGEMRNCAWVFDLIPLEVSILIEVGAHLLDLPFFTFVQKEGEAIMGPRATARFGGYFPIRFNYDDTYHSGGNMSIQVHPDEQYAREVHGEHGRQDESYYVVATGHGAKTYLGFREEAKPEELLEAARRSETEGTPVDHDRFVQAFPSRPGSQFLIPGGTIHASGRNQVVLEIGSLTVGSYTYKLYDYLRRDVDGSLRPIHTYHGVQVLKGDRKTSWVEENLVQDPRLVRRGSGWAEYIVGEHPLIYFSLRRLELERECEDDTAGTFHVLTLVDGEEVVVESLADPALCYHQSYLDIVVVPATVGKYRVRNLGAQPVVMHKTLLKDPDGR